MIEEQSETGLVCIYDEAETEKVFRPLREQIFDPSEGAISFVGGPVFRQERWIKVIIRGALQYSDRSRAPRGDYADPKEWACDDPRDPLRPLLELLVEDGVSEVIHMSPHLGAPPIDAITTCPSRPALMCTGNYAEASHLTERLLFDHTGRWGFYGSEEEFGLLGGEPEFMERYIERAGGMEFIREKADAYWQHILDVNEYEAPYVARYYDLAGWDNPPRKKESSGD